MICEEFGVPPDVAERQDPSLCLRIMALRRFRDVWAMIEGGTPQEQLPATRATEKVVEVVVTEAKEQMSGR